MLEEYGPILLFILLGCLLGITPILSSKLVSKITQVRKKNRAKDEPYECGFLPFESARLKFDVRFYLVAILFIVFDLEVAFLFPWSVIVHHLSDYGFWAMAVFLGLLLVGFIYEWKKGALEWE